MFQTPKNPISNPKETLFQPPTHLILNPPENLYFNSKNPI
jgi:hypothetical protein